MILYRPAPQEFHARRNRPVIRIPLVDVRVARGEMASHEAYRRVVQVQPNADSAFIPTQALKTGLRISWISLSRSYLLSRALHSADMARHFRFGHDDQSRANELFAPIEDVLGFCLTHGEGIHDVLLPHSPVVSARRRIDGLTV